MLVGRAWDDGWVGGWGGVGRETGEKIQIPVHVHHRYSNLVYTILSLKVKKVKMFFFSPSISK